MLRVLSFFALLVASTNDSIAEPLIDDKILKNIERNGVARAIVATRETDDRSHVGTDRTAAIHLRNTLAGISGAGAIGAIDQHSAVVRLNRQALERLSRDPMVELVLADIPTAAIDIMVAESVTDIMVAESVGAPPVWQVGYDGRGFAIAFLDTGVEADHPFLRNKVVLQACFSVEDPTVGAESLCPAGTRLETGDVVDLTETAATGCPAAVQGCYHGSHVAGIAAGREMDDPEHPGRKIAGVARGAEIVAIQVFSKFTQPAPNCSPSNPCVMSLRSSMLRALSWLHSEVLRQKSISSDDQSWIAAVNLSLGGGRYTEGCDEDPSFRLISRRIQQLRGDGVATFIAAGNEGLPDAVAGPGCVRPALTIGATDADGKVAHFSNAGSLVDLFAPGVDIRSATTNGLYRAQSGTSSAAPVAAGAYVVLKSAFPDIAVWQMEKALKMTGKPSVDIEAAYHHLSELKSLARSPTSGTEMADTPAKRQ